jgi:predicted Zn-dependent peptidase
MKKYIVITIAIFIALSGAVSNAQEKSSAGSKVISELKYPELKWSVPEVGKEVQRVVLDNGIILYLLEDHELPLISANFTVRTGSIYDTKERQAIADITGTVMRTGGTKTYSPDSLNAILEFIAASVETGIGTESGYGSMSVMSKDLDLGLEILNEVLRFPLFSEEKIDLEKSQVKESILRRNDHPRSILGREFNHLIYGDHPYGSITEWDEVKNISRDDLIEYHKKYFAPQNIMMAFSGDFKADDLIKKMNNIFGDWAQTEIDFPPIPDVEYQFKPGVYLINKDISQGNVRVGHLGIKRDNPDKFAISIMNYILGGGSFTSRLTSRVRSDEGLAYSVRSSFSTSSRDYGLFTASTQTKSATAYRALEIFFEEFELIRKGIPTQDEFDSARDSYINNFIFQFDSPGEIVNRLMSLEYNGYPEDYYTTYLDNIRVITLEDIQRVAEKYLHPDSMTIMIVGNTSELEGDFTKFGSITNIELEEPKVD